MRRRPPLLLLLQLQLQLLLLLSLAPVLLTGSVSLPGSAAADGRVSRPFHGMQCFGSAGCQAELVIGILSSPGNFRLRQYVRSGWVRLARRALSDGTGHWRDDSGTGGSSDGEPFAPFKHYFIVGRSGNASLERDVQQESAEYGDIFVADAVQEDYRNISRKVLAFFDCVDDARSLSPPDSSRRMRWVLKCDDDSFVRVEDLLNELRRLGSQGLYWGYSHGPFEPNREGKWAVTEEEYPSDAVPGPEFVCGAGYVLSADLVHHIRTRAERDPNFTPFPMEDVGTGLLVSTFPAVPMHSKRIFCNGKERGRFLITHYVRGEQQMLLAEADLMTEWLLRAMSFFV